ncbi:sulfatase-like hydrolase/transferase [Halosquirtibacter xylanolyticus]|uniref:sulfatase-like hydrolase/transferase n=1 Tax=Halosquirtibacter xylanolyticus TaxID=3374599 RepID=UPI003748146F|nr:sulfatase-like hydrolase/transferase [Prolixibacteraceae bacterium]
MRQTNIVKLSLCLAGIANIATGCGVKKTEKKSEKSEKPNILLILTDDQRFSSIHALQEKQVITPNMDKLVESGTVFTNAHIMGSMSGAVCLPSRAQLMTGKYLFHLTDGGKNFPKEDVTLPETLKNNGYRTFGTGKWHNSKDGYARSFTDGGKIFFGGMSNHMQVPLHDFNPEGKYKKADRYVEKKFSSEIFADAAIDYISDYKADNPFFMFVSFTAPHDPRMAPKRYVDMYDPNEITLPPNYMEEHPFDNGELIIRDELLAPFPRTKDVTKKEIIAYYAMLTEVDEQIGRIIATLKKSGKYENTIIVFGGDNGLAVGQHGLMGKQNVYDHSIRVPLVFAGPGIEKGVKSDVLCMLSDVFPTVCDLTDIKTPKSIDTHSLINNIKNPNQKVGPYKDLYFAYKSYQRGYVDQEGWKMIRYNVKGKETVQLFNLKADPYEINNLANNPKYSDRVIAMKKAMQTSAKNTGDKVDFSVKGWNIPEMENWKENRLRRGLPIDHSAAKMH